MPTCPFCKNTYLSGEELQDHLNVKHPDETPDIGEIRRVQPKKFKKVLKRPPVVVDGDDIAKGGSKNAMAANIKKCRAYLQKLGYSAEIFVSTDLRGIIDDAFELQRFINLKWVIEIEADEIEKFMLDTAQTQKCPIVSNSKFSKYQKEYKGDWSLKNALKNYEINEGKVVIEI